MTVFFNCSFIRSSVRVNMLSSVTIRHLFRLRRSSIINIHLITYSFIHSFIHSFIYSFIHSFIHSFAYLFIHSFAYLFIHAFVYLFIHSFIHSFIRLFIHLFVLQCTCSTQRELYLARETSAFRHPILARVKLWAVGARLVPQYSLPLMAITNGIL